jgi:hypothetical protein
VEEGGVEHDPATLMPARCMPTDDDDVSGEEVCRSACKRRRAVQYAGRWSRKLRNRLYRYTAAGLSQLVHAQRLQRPLYHIACARLYTIWNTMFAIDLSNSGWSTYRVHLDPGAKMDFRTLTMYYYGGCSSSMDGVYCMDHLSILNS